MKKTNGYIAITTTILISAVTLAIAATIALTAIGQGQAGLALTLGEDALNLVEGCTEDALLKLRASSSYPGGSITRPEGVCSVAISNVGSDYTLIVTNSSPSKYKRTIQVVANKGSIIAITSWKEI